MDTVDHVKSGREPENYNSQVHEDHLQNSYLFLTRNNSHPGKSVLRWGGEAFKNSINLYIIAVFTLGVIELNAREPNPFDVPDAVAEGAVTFKAKSTNSFSMTQAVVTNKTEAPIDLDLSRTILQPVGGFGTSDAQRIGIARVTGTKAYRVCLEPNSTYNIDLETRCLDHSRPAPATGTSYFVSRDKLPKPIADLLRNNASQNEVWAATDGDNSDLSNQIIAAEWKACDLRNYKKHEVRFEGEIRCIGLDSATDKNFWIKRVAMRNNRRYARSGTLELSFRLLEPSELIKFFKEKDNLGGVRICAKVLDPLEPGIGVMVYDEDMPINDQPKRGVYFLLAVLCEYSANEFRFVDYCVLGDAFILQ